MPPGDGLPESGDLSFKNDRDEEQRVHLRLVGPSSQGQVYRSANGADFYRLIPIRPKPATRDLTVRRCDDAPIERRHEVRRWIAPGTAPEGDAAPAWTRNPTAYNLAPIVEADLAHLGQSAVFFVRYGLHAEQTLVEVLADPNPLGRIDHAILLLRALPVWRIHLYAGLLPMPADVVFSDRGHPFLLPVPFWRFPDVESVFASPERILYLAPEYVRGGPGPLQERNLDTYAVGAMLMQCFHRVAAPDDAGSMLLRAATGSIWNNLQSDLPFWMQSLAPSREATAAVRRTVDGDPRVRGAFDPLELADRLVDWRRRMAPKAAVDELIREGRTQDAYVLLQDVLLTEESREEAGEGARDLLLRAARVALHVQRPLEAVDFYEKAIARAPRRSEAYEEQLRLLLSPAVQALLHVLAGSQGDPGPQVEAQVCRDFEHVDSRHRTEALELEVARYLLGRPDATRAATFIYACLFDAQGTFLWWKFSLWLSYAEALLRLARPRQAGEELNKVIMQLREAHKAGRVKEAEMAGLRSAIERLKDEIERAPGDDPASRRA